ncbi:titin-like isoform X1, partial [Leptotrombidium deliense]
MILVGRDESFRIDTFEYRLLREIEYRQTLIRQYSGQNEIWEQQRPAVPNEPITAPQLKQKPRNSKLIEGKDATFQVQVISNPPPKLYWFKNGQKICSSQRYRINYENGIASLRIIDVQPEDAGYYTLFAENNLGHVVCSAHLVIEASETTQAKYTSVKRKDISEYEALDEDGYEESNKSMKPHFYKIPANIEVTEGKMARFDCRVGGRPPPDVSWYINGRKLVDDHNYKLIVNEGGVHSLMIKVVSREDAGTITCIAKNRNG